jgi:hypothetical protein
LKRVYFALVLAVIFSFHLHAKEIPAPFGIQLGKDNVQTVKSIIQKEGGRITEEGYRLVNNENIQNPDVYGIFVKNLPIDYLKVAKFWFYKGTVYEINYILNLDMDKKEFYEIYNQLKSKYGTPVRYVKPYLADGIAVWKIDNYEISLSAPWVSWNMYLTYKYLPLSKLAEQSDKEVYQRETTKPKKGF